MPEQAAPETAAVEFDLNKWKGKADTTPTPVTGKASSEEQEVEPTVAEEKTPETTTVAETTATTEAETTAATETQDDDSFSWDSIEKPKAPTATSTDDSLKDFFGEEAPAKKEENITPFLDRVKLDLGIEIKDYDDLVKHVKDLKENRVVINENEAIQGIRQFLSMDNKNLVTEALKDKGFTDEDIEKYFDETSELTVKERASDLRKQLETSLKVEQNKLVQAHQSQTQTFENQKKEFDTTLAKSLSETSEIFGGKVKKDQMVELFKYITSGKFQKEALAKPEGLRDLAWFWKHRDYILNTFKSKGKSEATKTMVERMTVVEDTHRGTPRKAEVKEGEFDVSRWREGRKTTTGKK